MSLYSNIRNLLIKNSHINWAVADQAIVSGSNLLTMLLLARILGVSGFGEFSLAWLVVLFANMVQQAVIVTPMMSFAPKQPDENKADYFGAVFIQMAVFVLVCSLVTLLGVKFAGFINTKWDMPNLAWPLAVTVCMNLFQDFLRRYFYTIGRPMLSFISDFFSYISQILVLLFLCFAGGAFMDATTALWVVAATTSLGILVVLKSLLALSFSANGIKIYILRHWNFSKWLTASAVIQWFTSNIFTIAAGSMLGAAPVGALKAAQTLLGVTHIMFLALENIIPLKAAELLAKNNASGMIKYLCRTGAVGVGFVVIVALVFAVVPDFWIRFLYGEQFVPYSYLVRWIAVFYVLFAIGLPVKFGLSAMEETKIFFYTQVLVAVLSIISVNIVINKFGIAGVPMASIVVQVIVISLGLFWLRKALAQYKTEDVI